jgi:ribosomal protein L7Ae-like RNA K-turn-binding protein
MKHHERMLSYVGLAQRAGKLVSGDEPVMQAIRNRSAQLVFVATDASELAKKKYRDKCLFYKISVIELLPRSELGRSIGKQERVVLAVLDLGLSKLIRKELLNHTEVENH